MEWTGPLREGERRIAFSLIAPMPREPRKPTACLRVAPNAAALALPQSGLAVAGRYGPVDGQLVVLAEDHLYGHALLAAGADGRLLSSDGPIDIDWDFTNGTATVVTTGETTLELALDPTADPKLGGRPVPSRWRGTTYQLDLPPGRHLLTGAKPPPATRTQLAAALERLLDEGRHQRQAAQAGPPARIERTGAPLPVAMTAQVGGSVADMISLQPADENLLAVAEANTIHLLAADGTETRQLKTDAAIRVLHGWAPYRLLLAGCVDEQVVAFDRDGQRAWTFTSEMDPAVYRAAKTYWFKSAPGHEGIHGLYSGAFDHGRSRCFVGSACTLEVLDQNGQLVKRMPVFWGPGRMFLLVPGPDGSRNLLIARWPNGTDRLAIVNSRTLSVTGTGYAGVPEGHSYIGGWTAQNRTGLFYEDLDGDGRHEVATAINGVWNRVTVYTEDGRPRYNAQFGPGPSNAPRSRIRDMDVGDLDGDGTKEMVVGLAEGLVVALSHDCQKRWATRLPSPPRSLRCVTPPGAEGPRIVIGCDDGTVAATDGRGTPVAWGRITGRPTHMEVVRTAPATVVVLATDRGQVKGFRVAP